MLQFGCTIPFRFTKTMYYENLPKLCNQEALLLHNEILMFEGSLKTFPPVVFPISYIVASNFPLKTLVNVVAERSGIGVVGLMMDKL